MSRSNFVSQNAFNYFTTLNREIAAGHRLALRTFCKLGRPFSFPMPARSFRPACVRALRAFFSRT